MAPAKLDSAGYINQLTPKLETMPDEDVTVTVKYLQSETEQTIDGIRYYIYTQGGTAHAEIMPGQTSYSDAIITIPCHIIQTVTAGISVAMAIIATASRKLPLCFGR